MLTAGAAESNTGHDPRILEPMRRRLLSRKERAWLAWQRIVTRSRRLTLDGFRPGPREIGLAVASVLVTLAALEVFFRVHERERDETETFAALPEAPGGTGAFTVLGIGESSMFAEPYDTRFSFADLVAMHLRRSHPGRQIATRLVARKGATIESLRKDALRAIAERPSLVVVLAGHNDFHGAFSHRAACASEAGQAYRSLRHSALFRFLHSRLARTGIAEAPRASDRAFFDRPIVCRPEWDDVLERFRNAVTSIAGACRRAGVPAVLVFPAGNEVEFNPNRSVFEGTSDERARLERDFEAGESALLRGDLRKAEEAFDRARSVGRGFAELEYASGRLSLARGDTTGGRRLFELAKEEDGFPWRALDAQRAGLAEAARRFDLGFVDGRTEIARASQTSLLDGTVFHDIHHPTLVGYQALARAVTRSVDARQLAALGPPSAAEPPSDADVLEQVRFSSGDTFNLFATRIHWFDVFSDLSFDPTTRLFLLLDNLKALRSLNPVFAAVLYPPEFETRMRERLLRALARHGLDRAWMEHALAGREPLLARYSYLPRDVDRDPVHLDGLPSSMRLGKGSMEDGRSSDGTPLVIRGVSYQDGFCANPPSDVVFRLSRRHSRLAIAVEMSDRSAPAASAGCKVVGDDRVLSDVGRVAAGEPARRLELDVGGVDMLHLVCDDGGDGWAGDQVAWFSARLDAH